MSSTRQLLHLIVEEEDDGEGISHEFVEALFPGAIDELKKQLKLKSFSDVYRAVEGILDFVLEQDRAHEEETGEKPRQLDAFDLLFTGPIEFILTDKGHLELEEFSEVRLLRWDANFRRWQRNSRVRFSFFFPLIAAAVSVNVSFDF
jgi:hypothetical protein